jgi:hypothetical protein
MLPAAKMRAKVIESDVDDCVYVVHDFERRNMTALAHSCNAVHLLK